MPSMLAERRGRELSVRTSRGKRRALMSADGCAVVMGAGLLIAGYVRCPDCAEAGLDP